ncbi:hypothetical protein [Agriterribacter sp.]|uniref:hypothetical protein n=1 Tax=Agriterribacter sp. TaxID=2821509 RepID=UPI002C258C60|nr:hypothetical protein [Agriterribacter sp.]HTN05194.1 hypothetical protein [Agriterribacter sp.]
MKTAILIIAATLALSCNNNASSGSTEQQNNASIPKTLSDTLYKAAMEGHDVGMAKMGEIARYQKLIKQKTDSLAALKSKAALQPALDSALQELTYAEELMNRWMQDFDPDKAGSTETEKISFYRGEKEKIDTVNARIFKSIERAKQVVE